MGTPSFSYPGGKHYQRNWIVAYFPKKISGVYCEPFSGRANVFWKAAESVYAKSYWLNDLKTSDFLKTLLETNEEDLLEALGHTYPTRKEYGKLRREKSLRAVLCEPWITFSGGGWGQGYRSGDKTPTVEGYKRKVLEASRILKDKGVRVTSWDYRKTLERLKSSDFAYLDPPYKNCDVRSYRNSSIDHDEMIELLGRSRFRWILSEYQNECYDRAFGPPLSYKEMTLKVSGKLVSAERRTEVLYSNLT